MEESGFTLLPINDFRSSRTFYISFIYSPQLALQDRMILLIKTLYHLSQGLGTTKFTNLVG